MHIHRTIAPLCPHICAFCKNNFVKIYNLLLGINSSLHAKTHLFYQGLITTILPFNWHLCHHDDFLFDDIGTVDSSETPWLDEFVRELSMKQDASCLYTPCYPRLQCLLRCKIVDMLLIQVVLVLLLLPIMKSML